MQLQWDGQDLNQNQGSMSNISSLSNSDLLDCFKSENWEKMDEQARIDTVQEMENRNAASQGRIPANVVSSNDPSFYGQFTSTQNTIMINVSDFSSYDVLDTYIHESNHAYQQSCIDNHSGQYDNHTRTMLEAELARDEAGNLYNYRTTTPEYDMQCSEMDSNNRAVSFLISEQNRFGADQTYQSYILERNSHYTNLNFQLENNYQTRDAMQLEQLYEANARGDLSDASYNLTSSEIKSGVYIDPVVTESFEIGQSLLGISEAYSMESSEDMSNGEGSNDLSLDDDDGISM